MGRRVYLEGVYQDRWPIHAECRKLQETFTTTGEQQAEDEYCNDPTSTCHDGDWDYCSPIVIPLTENTKLAFTSPDEGVWFDLDGGGLDRVGWTREGELLALLWRDRNANDFVDDGSELFGSATPLLTGGFAVHGYQALAEFDALELGGNQNGWADAGDYFWSSLRLWLDLNHNGISEREELSSLEDAGVYAISLEARHSRVRDAEGNWLKWRSPAFVMRRESGFVAESVDIFFVHAKHPERD